ncbi:MAG TPA: helix-turn-helix transcriptional regulator [Edaphobacter sp.]|nr:helix-turn-helix transcriptional regulator [Edaphobacter sp.]
MKTLHDKVKALPAGRRKKIASRTDQLIREEMTMRDLRKARQMTQEELAKLLNVKQEQISRMEKRTDMHLSTLRRQIEAMGGELVLTAQFKDGAPVRLAGLAELDA